jgi:hypothetical protein
MSVGEITVGVMTVGEMRRPGVNKVLKENNNNKIKIQSCPFIYKPGEHRKQSRGEKNTQNYEPNEFDRMRVNASEAISV